MILALSISFRLSCLVRSSRLLFRTSSRFES